MLNNTSRRNLRVVTTIETQRLATKQTELMLNNTSRRNLRVVTTAETQRLVKKRAE